MKERPPPPDALVGALQDRIHPTSGRLIAATPVGATAHDILTAEAHRLRLHPHVLLSHYDDLLQTLAPVDDYIREVALSETIEHYKTKANR